MYWPILSIETEHFTAPAFKAAIEYTATDFKRRCDWVWVDIAYNRQEHDEETEDAATLRGEEIGRQVEIFGRAMEVFVWLSSL